MFLLWLTHRVTSDAIALIGSRQGWRDETVGQSKR